MDRPQPKFAVNEVVWVLPGAGHRYQNTVVSCAWVKAGVMHNEHGNSNHAGWFYQCEDQTLHTGGFWGEEDLRKVHQPGTKSFDEIMSTLKSGQPA